MMKKYILLFLVVLLIKFLLSPALASDTIEKREKMIWIDQLKQVGAAYENGKKVMEFPVLTGDDETTAAEEENSISHPWLHARGVALHRAGI